MSARPAVAPPPAWRFPAVRRSALANGLVIETVHLPGRPVAVAVLGLDVPLAAEPPGLDGALLAMAHTFAEGAGHLTSDELVSRLARVGATWFPGSGPDGPRLVVEVPTAGSAPRSSSSRSRSPSPGSPPTPSGGTRLVRRRSSTPTRPAAPRST
ncbi:hypothetical protein ACFQ9X_33300 [Catenulispora yoronensis]